jgi:hypothetical protein
LELKNVPNDWRTANKKNKEQKVDEKMTDAK